MHVCVLDGSSRDKKKKGRVKAASPLLVFSRVCLLYCLRYLSIYLHIFEFAGLPLGSLPPFVSSKCCFCLSVNLSLTRRSTSYPVARSLLGLQGLLCLPMIFVSFSVWGWWWWDRDTGFHFPHIYTTGSCPFSLFAQSSRKSLQKPDRYALNLWQTDRNIFAVESMRGCVHDATGSASWIYACRSIWISFSDPILCGGGNMFNLHHCLTPFAERAHFLSLFYSSECDSH